ncbi:MAG: hypothetical protein ACRC2R_06295 [Xenococcaceae cyanobacterium]
MTTKELERSAIATQEKSPTITQNNRKNLVARWIVDEKSKLFCQWVFEN